MQYKSISLLLFLCVLAAICSCRSQQAMVATAQHSTQSSTHPADESSCRAFVQDFYDWYYNKNRTSDKLMTWQDAMRKRPQAFSPELLSLLQKNAHIEAKTGSINSFDMDPFLNSQDPDGRYDVASAKVSDNLCSVEMNAAASVRPLVAWQKDHWTFANFRYRFSKSVETGQTFPDDDLLAILHHAFKH